MYNYSWCTPCGYCEHGLGCYYPLLCIDNRKPPPRQYMAESCVICLDKKPEVGVKPCNHICMCKKCVNNYELKTCPVCREKLSGFYNKSYEN